MKNEIETPITAKITNSNKDKLIQIAKDRQITIGRLLAIAIEHEFEKEVPFEYNYDLPTEEYTPLAFIEEASKILNFMKKTYGLPLIGLCLLRHEIGIPDKETFLLAFRECLLMKQIEEYKPRKSAFAVVEYDKEFVFYRITGSGTEKAKKVRNKADRYAMLQKLKKEFKDE